MLSLNHHDATCLGAKSGATLCDRVKRREWLRVGGLVAFGLSLPQLVSARATIASPTFSHPLSCSFKKANSCIVLFMLGGPRQHETWDPKPDAPSEIRGDLGTIANATQGLRVGELMPQTAKLTDRLAVLRAMATDHNAHSSSGYWMLTGYPHSPKNSENALPGAPNDWPSTASVVRHLKGDATSILGSDQAYSALLTDLEQGGMLDETLVVWMGEFGRSPKINPSGGRDHWGHVFSAALAGGGIQGGAVYGQSDRQGGYPLDGRVEPQDLTATIYHCLGFRPETEMRDRLNRPLTISKGHPIEAILR